MSRVAHSASISGKVASEALNHLLRKDGQEDLCFALWHPSAGKSRQSGLVRSLILPRDGERNVHGNASFNPAYLERALGLAAKQGAGLALLHSHPAGRGWQGMSEDDVRAERDNAGAVFGATGRPFLGLTLAGDGTWSARFWERTAPRTYNRNWCGSVRVTGDSLAVHFMDRLAAPPEATREQIRTVSAWGDSCQRDLARLRIGVIGAGSVGGVIADALGRIGIEDVMLVDFDFVEEHNLDRLAYATRKDIGREKIEVLAEHILSRATAKNFRAETISAAVYEDAGFRAALDCDLLFSCVDRPWGRYILNLIAYAHLIPVIDGGIAVRTNKYGKLVAADWRAHTATVGRPCLQCLTQYDPAFVQLEREGMLDDPEYIKGLPDGHPLKSRENVYAFALSCGSFQLLQMLAYVVAPLERSNPGPQIYHFVGGMLEPPQRSGCKADCDFPGLVGLGDDTGIHATGPLPSNLQARRERTKNRNAGSEKRAPWWRRLFGI